MLLSEQLDQISMADGTTMLLQSFISFLVLYYLKFFHFLFDFTFYLISLFI